MRTVIGVLVAALGLPAVASGAYVYTERAVLGGVEEPLDGSSVCAEFLGEGTMVYIYPGMTQADAEAGTSDPFGLLASAGSVIGDTTCTQAWKRMFCYMFFPPTFVTPGGTKLPLSTCKSDCDKLWDTCESGFANVIGVGFGDNLIQCDDTIADPLRSASFYFNNYFASQVGKDAFAPSQIIDVPGEGNVTVPCFDIAAGGATGAMCPRNKCFSPRKEYLFGKDPADDAWCAETSTATEVDCERCSSECQFECTLPAYDDAVFDFFWVVRWLPPFVALPFNMMIVANELSTLRSKDKKKRRNANLWVLITGALALLYTVLETLPTMFLKHKMGCGELETYDAVRNSGGNAACDLLKLNVHLLQMLFAAVGVTLYQLRCKIHGAMAMKSHSQSMISKVLSLLYVFGPPMILLCVHAAQPVMNGSDTITAEDGTLILRNMDNANALRYAFSCGPRFETLEMEWAIIMAPLMVYGALLVIASGMLMQIVAKMIGGAATSGASGKGKASKAQINLAKTTIKFAVSCVVLVIMLCASLAPFMQGALQFTQDVTVWGACATTGINLDNCPLDENGKKDVLLCPRDPPEQLSNMTRTLERCGPFDESVPAPILLILLNLGFALPPAIFGALFGYRLLQTKLKAARSKIQPSFGSSKAASSVASEN